MAKKKFKFGSEEQKQAWIAEQIDKKNAERKNEFENSGVRARNVCCITCFHFGAESCPGINGGRLDVVCKYWYSPNAPVIGTAYLIQSIGADKYRKVKQ